MIPDFISAIYLWIADKIGGPYPVWRSWLAPICIFIFFLGVAVLLVTGKGTIGGEPPPATAVVVYQLEIEALKQRASTAEANIVALAETVNKLVVAINRIKPPPSLGNLATKSELDRIRLEAKALEKELTRITNIYGHYQLSFDSQFGELKQAVEELEKILTAHTDNTTIHREEVE